MKYIACLLLPLLPGGIEGNDFVLECKGKSQTETAFLCRPVAL